MEGNKNLDNNDDKNGQANNGAGSGAGTPVGAGNNGTPAAGEGANNGGATGGNNGGGTPAAGGAVKGYTEEQVKAMTANSTKQGKDELLKELGIDPTDAKTVAMIKAMVASQKSDEQKAVETHLAEAAKLAEADRRATLAEAKAEAMQLGAESQYVEDVVTLAMSKMKDGADLKTLVGEVKTKYPVWFGVNKEGDDGKGGNGNKGATGQRGTGSSVHGNGQSNNGNNGEKGLGARLAAQRKSAGKKFSYWSKE